MVRLLAAVLVVAPVAGLAAESTQSVKSGVAVAVTTHAEIKAPPAKVWAQLCSSDGFSALTGVEIGKGAQPFAKVGDAIAFKLPGWNDTGRMVVTTFEPNKELRAAWDPASADYMGQIRVVLKAGPKGTTLDYCDRYTANEASDEALKKIREKIAASVEKFRARVEAAK